MGGTVAIPRVNQQDWFTSSDSNTFAFPGSFRHFLQVWRVNQVNQVVKCSSVLLNDLTELSPSESYIMLHIEHSDREAIPIREHRRSKRRSCGSSTRTKIPTTNSIQPKDLQFALVSKLDHRNTPGNIAFEIHVWNGKDALPSVWSSAIAKGHQLDGILMQRRAKGKELESIIPREDWVPLNVRVKALARDNVLVKNLTLMIGVKRESRHGSLPAYKSTRVRKSAMEKTLSAPTKGKQGLSALALPLMKVSVSDCEQVPKDERTIKQEKLDICSKQCSMITPNLYLSGNLVASNMQQLKENNINTVVNCAGTICKNYFESEFDYITLFLADGQGEDISSLFLDILDSMNRRISHQKSVLIHCQQGVSRSATMVIMYLMWKTNQPYEKVFAMVKEKRNVVSPNTGFLCQLLLWEQRLGLRGHSPALPWLVLLSQHHKDDPKRVAVRTIDPISADSLDPRGVFLLFTEDKVFSWIGKEASNYFVQKVDRYINLAHKYLKFPSLDTKISLQQGKETPEFCSILSLDSPNSITHRKKFDRFFS